MDHLGDITYLHGGTIPVVDIITGGSPCQDLSVAGKRAGLNGERSGLFMEQIRIVKEMRAHDRRTGRTGYLVRPRYMVWENVPGAFSSNKGADFQAVLSEIVKVAEPDAPDVPMPENGKWPKAGCLYSDMGGWSVAWRVHDAQFWGVPQRRKRIALVADFGGLSAPEILFERKGLSGNIEPCGTAREGTAAGTESGVDPAICLQGNGIDRADTAGCNGRGWREGQSYTLNTIDRPAVYAFDSLASNSMKSSNPHSGCRQVEVAKTLDCFDPNPSKNQGGVAVVASYQEVTGTLNPGAHPGSYNGQDAHNDMLVAPTVGALCASDYKGIRNQSMNEDKCLLTNTVRRLTPLECERLQGFPDGWTDIGEWTDSKGKKHKPADSPRYKALGNSIALPFWQWMARRICAQYERTPKMGSLFDGIGGFPLVFQRSGAVPVWASEIEEFPIAVTKLHFPEERSIE